MLCLGRKWGQAVIIRHAGETLRVVLYVPHEMSASHARLGFDGPRSFEIVREELVEADDTNAPARP